MSNDLFPSDYQGDTARIKSRQEMNAEIERLKEETRLRQSSNPAPYHEQRGYRSKYSGRMR